MFCILQKQKNAINLKRDDNCICKRRVDRPHMYLQNKITYPPLRQFYFLFVARILFSIYLRAAQYKKNAASIPIFKWFSLSQTSQISRKPLRSNLNNPDSIIAPHESFYRNSGGTKRVDIQSWGQHVTRRVAVDDVGYDWITFMESPGINKAFMDGKTRN